MTLSTSDICRCIRLLGLNRAVALSCAGLAPPTPLAEEQSLLFFHGDARLQPALLLQLAEDAEKRMIDWKIVRAPPPS